MKARVLTAIVALLVVIPPIFFGGYLGLALLVTLVMLIGVEEFSRLLRPQPRYDLVAGEMVAALAVFWAVQQAARAGPASQGPLLVIAVGLAVVGLFVLHLLTIRDIRAAGPQLMGSIASLFYLPLLLAFLPLIRDQESGLDWLFFLMLVTWAGDSGAYLAGRALGRHKLYALVSPGKTVEGLMGGVVASIAGAFLAKAWFFQELTLIDCLVLAPLADLAGVLGDLCESMLKRSAGVKDSGRIFPGHGGVLDRVDSLLFSAPVVYAYIILWR